MSKTVSDQILQRLRQWGVQRVYGYPGDGINGLMGAFGRVGDGMKFIQARHEELAAFMACAHAKFTCSTACTTPAPITSRCWPSWASRRARRWAATTSRRWTC